MSKKEIIIIIICTAIISSVMMCGCSPKIIGSNTSTATTTDTSYKPADVTVPESTHTHQIDNATQVCDSLYKIIENMKAGTQVAVKDTTANTKTVFKYRNPPAAGKPASGADIEIDSQGKMTIICREEEYKLRLDSAITVINTLRETKTETTVAKCNSDFHVFTTWFFYLVAAVIVIYFIIKVR